MTTDRTGRPRMWPTWTTTLLMAAGLPALAGCGTHASLASLHTPVAHWPDAPWDQFCGGQQTSCPNLQSPAFWTPFKVSDITTRVWDPAANAYRDVERGLIR